MREKWAVINGLRFTIGPLTSPAVSKSLPPTFKNLAGRTSCTYNRSHPCRLVLRRRHPVFRGTPPARSSFSSSDAVVDLERRLDNLQMDDASQMLSLPPEPPDIRDWFSSYESLQLSELEGSVGGENEEEDGKIWLKDLQFLGKDETAEAKYPVDDVIHETAILNKCDSVISAREKIAAASVEALPRELNSDTDCTSTKMPTISSENQKEPESDELTGRISKEEGIVLTGRISKEEEVVGGRASREQRTHLLSPKEMSQMSPKQPLSTCILEKKTYIQNDGFISTKKKRENYGFSNKEVVMKNKNQKILPAQDNGDSPLNGNRHGNVIGKENIQPQAVGLAESANAQVKVGTAEISGKWLCPQKKKPYVAPPMKQLRLQHWFHQFR